MKKRILSGILGILVAVGVVSTSSVTAFAAGPVWEDGVTPEEYAAICEAWNAQIEAEARAQEEAIRAQNEAERARCEAEFQAHLAEEERQQQEEMARLQAESEKAVEAYFAELRAYDEEQKRLHPENYQNAPQTTLGSTVQSQADSQNTIVEETKNNVSKNDTSKKTTDKNVTEDKSEAKDNTINEKTENTEQLTAAKTAKEKLKDGVEDENEAIALLEAEGNTDIRFAEKIGNFFGGIFKNIAGVWEGFIGFFRK